MTYTPLSEWAHANFGGKKYIPAPVGQPSTLVLGATWTGRSLTSARRYDWESDGWRDFRADVRKDERSNTCSLVSVSAHKHTLVELTYSDGTIDRYLIWLTDGHDPAAIAALKEYLKVHRDTWRLRSRGVPYRIINRLVELAHGRPFYSLVVAELALSRCDGNANEAEKLLTQLSSLSARTLKEVLPQESIIKRIDAVRLPGVVRGALLFVKYRQELEARVQPSPKRPEEALLEEVRHPQRAAPPPLRQTRKKKGRRG